MARISQNPITSNLHGAIGKNIVFRTRNGKTFASKYPDMSRVKLSASQKKQNTMFAKAVAFAQASLITLQKKPRTNSGKKANPSTTLQSKSIIQNINS
jgi:hypothetical protein